jgi:hypothetical protein
MKTTNKVEEKIIEEIKENVSDLKEIILAVAFDYEDIMYETKKDVLEKNIQIIVKKYEKRIKRISTLLNKSFNKLPKEIIVEEKTKQKIEILKELDIDESLLNKVLSITKLDKHFSEQEKKEIINAINLKNKTINNIYIKNIQKQLLENDVKQKNKGLFNKDFELFFNNLLSDIQDSQKKELLEMFMEFNNNFKEEIFSSNISNFNEYIELISNHTFPKMFIPKENSDPLEYTINKSGANVSDVLFLKEATINKDSQDVKKYETISLNITKNPISDFEKTQNITHPIKNELIGYIFSKYIEKGIKKEIILERYTNISLMTKNGKEYLKELKKQNNTCPEENTEEKNVLKMLEDLYHIKNMDKEFVFHQYIYNMNIEDILPIYKRYKVQKKITKDSNESFTKSFFSKELYKENLEEKTDKNKDIQTRYEKEYINSKDLITSSIEEKTKPKTKFEFKYNSKHSMVILNQLEFSSKKKCLEDIDFKEISTFIYMVGHLNSFFANNGENYKYYKNEVENNNIIEIALSHLTMKSVILEKDNISSFKEILLNTNSKNQEEFENKKNELFNKIIEVIKQYEYNLSPICGSFEKRRLMGDFLYVSSRLSEEIKSFVINNKKDFSNINEGILPKEAISDSKIILSKEKEKLEEEKEKLEEEKKRMGEESKLKDEIIEKMIKKEKINEINEKLNDRKYTEEQKIKIYEEMKKVDTIDGLNDIYNELLKKYETFYDFLDGFKSILRKYNIMFVDNKIEENIDFVKIKK